MSLHQKLKLYTKLSGVTKEQAYAEYGKTYNSLVSLVYLHITLFADKSRLWRILRFLLPTFKPSYKLIGSEAYNEVVHVWFRQMAGLIDNDEAQQYYMFHAERQPLNPLYLALSGQYIAAEAMLMNEELWPAARLPTNQERESAWLLDKDFGPDWLSFWVDDDPVVTHNGADFIFCATLLEKLREASE